MRPVVRLDLDAPWAARAEKRLHEVFRGRVNVVTEAGPARVRMVPIAELPNRPGRSEILVGVGEADLATQVRLLARFSWLNHLVSPATLDSPLGQTAIANVLWRIASGRSVGTLLGKGFRGRRATLRDSSKRGQRIDEIAEAARRAGATSTLTERIRDVAEELITNAMYDAPAERRGVAADRSSRLVLARDEACGITYGVAEKTFLLRVRDRFGSLKRRRLVEVLTRCTATAQGDVALDTSRGGAGLGMWRIFSAASLVIVHVVPKISTDFIVGIDPLGGRRKNRNPTIHLFFDDDGDEESDPYEHFQVTS